MKSVQNFQGKRICVAVSGGVDSVALLHYLKTREKELGCFVVAAHCEHGIRGEDSLADMRFVQALCRDLDTELYLFQEDCPALAKKEGVSLETAARNFRYQCFATLVNEGKADLVATAHHQGDEAETVLFRIARGSALSGAVGMTETRGWLVRPFLSWTRADIEAYALENGLQHCEDLTNDDTAFTRNAIRKEVLPRLEKAVSGAAGNIARFAALAKADDELLYEYASKLISKENEGFLVAFSDKKPLFYRACLTAMKALGVEKDYTLKHLEAVDSLQNAERGAKADLPKGVQAMKTERGILLRKKEQERVWKKGETTAFSAEGFDGGKYLVEISREELDTKEWKLLRVDEGKIPANAVFRFREEGDAIECFGGGTKSLKKLFNERKIPLEEREYLPVIAVDRQVYAVCGVEISKKLKVDESTQSVLYIVLRKKKGERI